MKLPLSIAIKDFLGVYALTPFEHALLTRLSEALETNDKDVLTYQLARFTTVRRLIRALDEPGAHGYTNFYTLRFGKDVSAQLQTKRFASTTPQAVLATARVTYDDGEIDVKFLVVKGVLFRIEYRSAQRVYYPPNAYRIDILDVWPTF